MAHSEFHTDVSPSGKYFQLTFITGDKDKFLMMQELARTCVDNNELSCKIAKLEQELANLRLQQAFDELIKKFIKGGDNDEQ